jgi:hypothetical protein
VEESLATNNRKIKKNQPGWLVFLFGLTEIISKTPRLESWQ